MSSPAPAYTPHSAFTEDWSAMQPDMDRNQKKEPVQSVSPHLYHPDIQSPGLESVWGDDQGKEVVPHQYQQPQPAAGHFSYQDAKYPVEEEATVRRPRKCGLPRALCWLLLAILILVAVGLGVGLGVGFGTKKKSHPAPNGNVVNPAYLSKSGAFNGSGIAIASYSFESNGYGRLNTYFQHWSGQLRKIQYGTDGTWDGGDETNIVATNARNGTPISAVAYAMDKKATWHIFYIDTHNIIREKISDNTTNLWRDGPIGDMNLVAMNDSNVGLQACWYGNFYGQANYIHSPIPGTGANTTAPDSVIGMHLWYGREPTVLEEVTWTYNTTKWVHQDEFVANAHAGVGCYSWGAGSVSYVMTVNLNNAVQVAWKDLNSSAPTTSAHPVNKWVNTTFTIPNVIRNTSLGYTNFFYAQNEDRTIGGHNISFDAEHTKLASEQFTIPQPGLAGTHFSVTTLPQPSGGDSLLVLDQQNGTDITLNTRDYTSGLWTYATIPVPQQ